MRRSLPPLVLAACALALAPWAWGGVKVVTQADGRRVVVNEGTGERPGRARQPVETGGSIPRLRAARAELAAVIAEHAADHGIEPRLVQAVIQCESNYDPRAVSRVGAVGLMQLMPATALELAVRDPMDERQNVAGGTAYLRRMLDRFGRLDLALAAYNAGPEAVERYGGIPPYPETVGYVRKVLSLYEEREVRLDELPVATHPGGGRGRTRTDGDAPRLVASPSGRRTLTNAPILQ
ncbi:MAG TPA: lytic transglycosylase domain-containing protein [Thermoanaerobaculia bacterium]|nr:lytic transglycosylase domain-containing protein [Thermoanaerobaculia bacterium]